MNKSESVQLTEAFKESLSIIPDSVRQGIFIAGVSGGPDSMALLYLFHRFNIPVIVVHCNYGLRGRESDLDQKLTEDIATMWGYDCISTRFDPPKKAGINFQNWAREKRYQVFRDVLREENAGAIAVAHHMDDQLETIFQKILRGAGLNSWKGMQRWDGEVFRPLLNVRKKNILEFASQKNIPYRLDRSNEESTYARNFLRNAWFPVLDIQFPGWDDNILRIQQRADEFKAMADYLLEDQMLVSGEKLDRNSFIQLPSKLKPVILNAYIKKLYPDISLSEGFLMSFEAIESLQTGAGIEIGSGVILTRDRNFYLLRQNNNENSGRGISYTFDSLLYRTILKEWLNLRIEKWSKTVDPAVIQIDAGKLRFPVTVRKWENGDKMMPLGMNGKHQKISDLLTNRKISSVKKREALVLESFDKKVAALIFPEPQNDTIGVISEWVRCGDETENVLIIEQICDH